MSALLEVRGLEAGYGESQVLFGVDLDVAPGELVTLLGRNGMGKTTTVRALLGLLPVKAGTLRWNGHDFTGAPAQRVAALGIAVVPEGRQVFPNLTVRENLVAFSTPPTRSRTGFGTGLRTGFGTGLRTGLGTGYGLEKIWTFFPQLRERAGQLAGRLSGGEQQMLAIGRALMRNPDLLILDEATEGLAPLVREEVWQCLDALRKEGQTLLVIDKHVERLVKLADRHFILERGRVVWTGASAALAADRELQHRHLGV
jgi:branched-chain amino acid transport system ATP-binding protein